MGTVVTVDRRPFCRNLLASQRSLLAAIRTSVEPVQPSAWEWKFSALSPLERYSGIVLWNLCICKRGSDILHLPFLCKARSTSCSLVFALSTSVLSIWYSVHRPRIKDEGEARIEYRGRYPTLSPTARSRSPDLHVFRSIPAGPRPRRMEICEVIGKCAIMRPIIRVVLHRTITNRP